ncbi:MAG: hypothetical protein RLQ12_17250 [Cyclobacteriaceae bacterium]
MQHKNELRPVVVTEKGKESKGYFHRFVYRMSGMYSETKVLIEMENGALRYYDPFDVRFTDRKSETRDYDFQLKTNNPQ